MLQDTRVLAIDQLADERTDKPAVVKAVTVEVDTLAAQKLTLASQVGTLSLALRKAGEAAAGDQRRVSAEDLGRDTAPTTGPKKFSTVTVMRAQCRHCGQELIGRNRPREQTTIIEKQGFGGGKDENVDRK